MRNPVLCRLSFENPLKTCFGAWIGAKRVLGARICVNFMVSGQDLDSVMVV